MVSCVPSYRLKYKKVFASSWTTIEPATSPVTVGGTGKYIWTVEAKCSPSFYSSAASGPNYELSCKMENEEILTETDSRLTVYPNPSDGSFTISLKLPDELRQDIQIEILEQAGKVIISSFTTIENGLLNKQLSINDLASGFYWLRIRVNDKTYMTKLIIQTS